MSNSTYIEMEDEKPDWWEERYKELKAKYDSLPTIRAWIAMDADGELSLWKDNVLSTGNYIGVLEGYEDEFPELTPGSKPIQVEFLMRRL